MRDEVHWRLGKKCEIDLTRRFLYFVNSRTTEFGRLVKGNKNHRLRNGSEWSVLDQRHTGVGAPGEERMIRDRRPIDEAGRSKSTMQ